MNPIDSIDLDEVKIAKKLLSAFYGRHTQGKGTTIAPLAFAAAAEELAQEIRRDSASAFEDCPPIRFPRTNYQDSTGDL